MKTFHVWLAFDFGLKSDYDGLYKFLDAFKAEECGNSTAFFEYKCPCEKNEVFLKALQGNLKNKIKLTSSDRLYVVFKEKGGVGAGGVFIYGTRKKAPWTGFAHTQNDEMKIEGGDQLD